jgi:hypothetical protein
MAGDGLAHFTWCSNKFNVCYKRLNGLQGGCGPFVSTWLGA